jgi:Tol biopolymer transport system component
VLSVRKSLLCCLVSVCALCGWAMFGVAITPALAVSLPSVSEESLVKIGTAGATLSARVSSEEVEETYSVEYGTSTAYGSQTVPVAISPGTQTVSVGLTGLQPDTEYYARFVATNELGSKRGAGVVFTTYSAGISGLPDGRVYELVTPAENENAEVYELSEGIVHTGYPFEAAADGDAVAYITTQSKGGNGSTGNDYGEQHLAVRGVQGGWTQTNITPATSEGQTFYEGFSSELSSGVLTTMAEAPFSPRMRLPEFQESPYSYFGLFSTSFDGAPFYAPLFDGKPPHRVDYERLTDELTLHQNGVFGSALARFSEGGGPLYAGSSASFGDLFFEANDQLLNGEGPPALETELDSIVQKEMEGLAEIVKQEKEENQTGYVNQHAENERELAVALFDNRNELYESSGGHVSLVNVLPDGKIAPGATFGGGSETGPDFTHDISENGSRVFWTDLETSLVNGKVEQQEVVYVRVDGDRTVQVSQGAAQFRTATPDGAYAFYTEAGKLWRYDVEDEARVELAGVAGGVVGVVGANETGPDGSYVYFVSTEALPGENQDGKQSVVGQDNVYVYEPDGETGGSHVAFVATLGGGEAAGWAVEAGKRLSSITPSGQALTFTSRENLTGKPYPEEGQEEVYVYDANEGSLICASCRAQASGGHYPSSASRVYTYRRISEDGNEVFFDSAAPLVARDVNGTQDVYEWERDGSGECKEADGCVYLLSGGIEGDAFLVDASVSGNDVFFVARQKLVLEDGTDDAVLYDARADGVPPVTPPQCSGTACQGVPSPPPVFATPASVTFEGVGNFPPPARVVEAKSKPKVKACKKGYVRKNGRCVERKQKRKKRAKSTVKAGKSSTRGWRSR